MVNQAERVEDAVNLRNQIEALGVVPESDLLFRDTTPRRHWETLYSMSTGEAIRVMAHRLESVLKKRLPDGSPAFTARQEQAPLYVLGTVKCFLSRGSSQRDLVDQLNIAPGYYCPAEHLANEMAALTHAEHRHPSRWKAMLAHKNKVEQDDWRQRQEAQVSAILELARGNNNAVATPVVTPPVAVAAELMVCECGWSTPEGSKRPSWSLALHKRLHCPLKGV